MINHMTTEHQESTPRRPIPAWAQVLIWMVLLALLALLATGVMRGQSGLMSVGKEVPDFTLLTYEGYGYDGRGEVSLSELRGKVVLINFWASWCKPCESEALELEEAWQHYQPGNEVVFLGVDYVDTEPEARSYLAKFNISFPNGPDLGTRISLLFNRSMGVPETYILDRQGILRMIKIGPFQSPEDVIETVDAVRSGE